MPTGQPFTVLCARIARPRQSGGADLHLHSTYSDGLYTPTDVVDLARRSGLAAIALTDHDTLAGVREAREAARGTDLEIVSGVEISAELAGQEVHILGYFCRLDDPQLLAALERMGRMRTERFAEMLNRLQSHGVNLAQAKAPRGSSTLGRRHVAEMLVEARRAGSVREAFLRYLSDDSRFVVPKTCLPVAEALALVRGAGGVAAWAHPSYHCNLETLIQLRTVGLGALEVAHPGLRAGRSAALRALAAQLQLAVTGGSDCHGPEPIGRCIGARTISRSELEILRGRAATTR